MDFLFGLFWKISCGGIHESRFFRFYGNGGVLRMLQGITMDGNEENRRKIGGPKNEIFEKTLKI